jgi:predicted membrane protein
VRLARGSIDLTTETITEDGTILELYVMLGGYKIRVPNDWKFDLQADVNMGEYLTTDPTLNRRAKLQP